MTPFAEYFDRVAVINLPSRSDRLRSIRREVATLGVSDDRLVVPFAPVPRDNGGFPSRGVYGNFLSHLCILKEALTADCKRVLVLEDDAIFSHRAAHPRWQEKFVNQAKIHDWSMWFLGHKLRRELRDEPKGVIKNKMKFDWAHAYAVQAESLPELIVFLEKIMSRPAGDAEGGKMYIDGAYTHYRETGSSRVCLVSNPTLSIQKGSDSNLAMQKRRWPIPLQGHLIDMARLFRDGFWRRTNIDFR